MHRMRNTYIFIVAVGIKLIVGNVCKEGPMPTCHSIKLNSVCLYGSVTFICQTSNNARMHYQILPYKLWLTLDEWFFPHSITKFPLALKFHTHILYCTCSYY